MYTSENIKPNQLRISITSRCNMDCTYCHNEGSRDLSQIMKYEDVELLLDNAMKYNFKEIRLTGGEPLTHSDIVKICKYLRSKYPNINVGLNSNGIDIDTLLELVDQNLNLIDNIRIGVDYFDSPISKNSSIGLPSKVVLNNVLTIKKKYSNIGIDSVYVDDDINKNKLIDWCISNHIYLKILEVVEPDKTVTDSAFEPFADSVIQSYDADKLYDQNHNCYFIHENGTIVRFISSFCRTKRCVSCMNKNMRVTSEGNIIRCLKENAKTFPLLKGSFDEEMNKALAFTVNDL